MPPDPHTEEICSTRQGLGVVAVRELSAVVFHTTCGSLCLKTLWLSSELGYQLCDNSVGVLFNDSTRLIMYNDRDSLQYIEQNSTESYFTVRSYPSALNKKVSPGDMSLQLGVAAPGEASASLLGLWQGGFQGETSVNWRHRCSVGVLKAG